MKVVYLPGGLKRGERLKDFQKFSCRTDQIFARKPKKKKKTIFL